MGGRGARAASLALASGGLYALALPPVGLGSLGWIALAPLFVAIAWVGPARAFWLGLLWFLAASFGFAAAMPHLISAYFETPWLVGASAFLSLTAVFGPLYGAYATWLSWLVRRGAANPLVAAAGFALIEWGRTSAGSIFGWALVAHTQTPGALVLQTADLGGAYLPGMILVATSFALASILWPPLVPGRRLAWVAAVAVVITATLAYGVSRIAPEPTIASEFRVALVQGGITHAERWNPAREAEDLFHYLELTRDTDLHEPDLVVWPEYAVSFNLRRSSVERTELFIATADGGPDLLFGAPYHRGGSPPVVQNSAFLLHDGALAGRYDKNELLPFAERNPWPEFLPLDREQYTPGGKAFPLRSGRVELGVHLCSEGLRPDVARQLTRNGATVLANLSNDSWLGTESAARIQLRSAALRAIENRRYLLRATGSGRSALVRPDGRVVVTSTFDAPDVIFGVVEPLGAVTAYTRYGDIIVLLALAIVLGGSLRAALPLTGVHRPGQLGFTEDPTAPKNPQSSRWRGPCSGIEAEAQGSGLTVVDSGYGINWVGGSR